MNAAPVYGLVLAGGRSTRMRADKAALTYQGHPQLERAMALLGAQLPRTFVSVRAEQAGLRHLAGQCERAVVAGDVQRGDEEQVP